MLYNLMENQFIHVSNILQLPVSVNSLKKNKLPNWSCLLNCCIECADVFVPDAEINDKDDVNFPFILFQYYKNIISCSLHKQMLPEHGKTYPSYMNIEHLEK